VRVTKQTTGKGNAFTGGKKTADNLYPITKLEACNGSPIRKKTRDKKNQLSQMHTVEDYYLLTAHMDRVTGHKAKLDSA
jgi:hypothetical protein